MKYAKQKFLEGFPAFKSRNFTYFWLGQCVSLIGAWMQRSAIVWVLYTLTKSPLTVGLLGVCQFLPQLLLGVFAGVIVDRFPKRKILILTQIMFMSQAIVLTFLTYFDLIEYWHIYILIAIYGVTQSLDIPARQVFLLELVGRKHLLNAISLNSTVINLTKIIGPSIAGFIMLKYSTTICFMINICTYSIMIFAYSKIKTDDKPATLERNPIFKEIASGFKFISKSRELFPTLILLVIVVISGFNIDVLTPVFAESTLNSGVSGYTTLQASTGIGALVGALMCGLIFKRGISSKMMVITSIAYGAVLVITSQIRSLPFAILSFTAIGYLQMTYINACTTKMQLQSTDEFRGRVMSIYSLVLNGLSPFGNSLIGVVMEYHGGAGGFLTCGTLCLTFIAFVFIAFKKKMSVLLSDKRDEESFAG